MFTGIVETLGKITAVRNDNGNSHVTVSSVISNELKIDQSVSHNGACLTVVELGVDYHTVTAIQETISKTNLGGLKVNDLVNLERCMQLNGRLDGHIVQGHVDQTGVCKDIIYLDGSTEFVFEYDASTGNVTVEKGSICVNGVSLTVIDSLDTSFKVAIIPYTFENTCFKLIKTGDLVNLEFDIIGKYVARLVSRI